MKGLNLAVVMVCVVLCGFGVVGSAFGAGGGGGGVDNVNSFNGNFAPNGYGGPQWHSYAHENEAMDYVSGSFGLQLNAETSSFENANWNFWTNSADTSYWNATCYLHGHRDISEECPQNQHWSQSVNLEDLQMDASLSLNCFEYSPKPDQDMVKALSLYGYFSISPSDLLSSYFSYREEMENQYTYPDGYDNPPVITQVPVWNGQYDLHGRFVASTIEEARGLGAQFAQDVPEPSCIVMMLSSMLAGIAVYLRRK